MDNITQIQTKCLELCQECWLSVNLFNFVLLFGIMANHLYHGKVMEKSWILLSPEVYTFQIVNNKGTDETVQMTRLVFASVVHIQQRCFLVSISI